MIAGLTAFDRLVTEAEALYRTGSEILDHHVGAFDEALDELEPARVLQVDCGRTLVRVVLQKIDRVGIRRGAAERPPRVT